MRSFIDWLRRFLKAHRITEDIGLNTNLIIEHYRGGKRILKREYHNIITNVGKAQDAGLFNGVVTTPFKYLAIGTGTTPASATDTALQSEITTGGGQRGLATVSRVTTAVENDTAQLVYQWDFTDSFAVTESGIFDSASGGNMAARQVFSAVNVASGDSLQLTWKIQKS